jgi:hypothetical protein
MCQHSSPLLDDPSNPVPLRLIAKAERPPRWPGWDVPTRVMAR